MDKEKTMNTSEEKIFGIVDDVESYNIAGLVRYIAIFTNRRIIFLKTAGATAGKLLVQGSLINQLQTKMESEGVLVKIKKMTPEEILNSGYETIVINKDEAKSLRLSEWPVLFRSKITYKSLDKKFKFKVKKKAFTEFQKYYISLITDTWQKSYEEYGFNKAKNVNTTDLNPQRERQVLRTLAGVILVVIFTPALIGHGLLVKDLMLLVPAVLLFILNKHAISTLIFFTLFYIFTMIGAIIKLVDRYNFVPFPHFLPEVVLILVLIGIVAYVWRDRKILLVTPK